MSKISPNFKRHEFTCKCGCGFDTVDVELLIVAELAREILGPYTPNSGCRCVNHNEYIQKLANPEYKPYSSKSQHLIGRAIDIPANMPGDLYARLDEQFPNKYGIGLYVWGVHIDTRNEKARWNS